MMVTFGISMKNGLWKYKVMKILRNNKIKFNTKERKGQYAIIICGWKGVIALCKILIPYSIVKKPIIVQMIKRFNYIESRHKNSNQNTPITEKEIIKLCKFVDKVHEINKGKNRKVKWTGNKIYIYLKKWIADKTNKRIINHNGCVSR